MILQNNFNIFHRFFPVYMLNHHTKHLFAACFVLDAIFWVKHCDPYFWLSMFSFINTGTGVYQSQTQLIPINLA